MYMQIELLYVANIIIRSEPIICPCHRPQQSATTQDVCYAAVRFLSGNFISGSNTSLNKNGKREGRGCIENIFVF